MNEHPTPIPAAGASKALQLPDELSVYTVGALRGEWLEWIAREGPAGEPRVVDGAAVTEVDAAGVQCLLALSHSLAAAGQPFELSAPSPALQAACRTLGLARLLPAPLAA